MQKYRNLSPKEEKVFRSYDASRKTLDQIKLYHPVIRDEVIKLLIESSIKDFNFYEVILTNEGKRKVIITL